MTVQGDDRMKIRFGIMGAGLIAQTFANAARLTDRAEVLAVASKTPGRAADFAQKNDIPTACSYQELLARSDIDAVYIATTTNFHYENAKACLLTGKHVLCEKAMVTCAAHAKELFDLAAEKGLFIMEAMWSRFLPSMVQARQWIQTGRIGKLQAVSAVIGFKCNGDPAGRLLAAELGGGALYDIGVYAIELVTYLVGQPVRQAMGFCRKNAVTGVDENDTFILHFDDVDASVHCLFTAAPKEYILVTGDKGIVEIPTAHINDECILYDAQRQLVEHFKQPFPQGNGFVYQIQEVAACIRAGKTQSDSMPHAATIECAEIFDTLLG